MLQKPSHWELKQLHESTRSDGRMLGPSQDTELTVPAQKKGLQMKTKKEVQISVWKIKDTEED